jgi:glycosyltransferase involved in cell wall biosynthesis
VRILHVVPTYIPAYRYGGPIVAVHALASSLAARGHSVDVFTTNVDGPGVSDVPIGVPVARDGVDITYFASSFPRLYISAGMRDALSRRVTSYDAVHLHSVFLWPTLAAARAAERAHVPYVISPRGMLVPELIRRKSRLVKSTWLRLFERRTFRRAAAVHFTSQREWDDARQLDLSLPHPFVIPNGVELFDANVSRHSRTILALGRINWKKGLDRLIEALPHVPGASLVIAGNDEEQLIPRLESLALRSGVRERVQFAGVVHGRAKEELLASASVLALPSHSENFGNVVLEALMARTPVVVTPEVGLASVISGAKAGLVAQGDPRALAAALNQLLDEPDAARQMGENGRRLVERDYSWSGVAAAMETMYLAIQT